MTVSYPCGKDNEVYTNDITPKSDAVITVGVSSKCTSNSDLGPEVYAKKKNGTESHRKRLAKAGGFDSVTVEEGGTAWVRCEGSGADGCNVEVVVNSVKAS